MSAAIKAYKAGNKKFAYETWARIDAQWRQLIGSISIPRNAPWRSVLISNELDNISTARANLVDLYDKGIFVKKSSAKAAGFYRKAFSPKIDFPSRNCKIVGLPPPVNDNSRDYASLYIYGVGVKKNFRAAREFLASIYGEGNSWLAKAIDNGDLPSTYETFKAQY